MPFADIVRLEFALFGAVMKQKYEYKVEEQVRNSTKISEYSQMHENGKMCFFCEFTTDIENRISRVLDIAESWNLRKMHKID